MNVCRTCKRCRNVLELSITFRFFWWVFRFFVQSYRFFRYRRDKCAQLAKIKEKQLTHSATRAERFTTPASQDISNEEQESCYTSTQTNPSGCLLRPSKDNQPQETLREPSGSSFLRLRVSQKIGSQLVHTTTFSTQSLSATTTWGATCEKGDYMICGGKL